MCACFTVHGISHKHVYVLGTYAVDTYDDNSTYCTYRSVDVEYKMKQYLCEVSKIKLFGVAVNVMPISTEDLMAT